MLLLLLHLHVPGGNGATHAATAAGGTTVPGRAAVFATGAAADARATSAASGGLEPVHAPACALFFNSACLSLIASTPHEDTAALARFPTPFPHSSISPVRILPRQHYSPTASFLVSSHKRLRNMCYLAA